ncbi:MAG TPA: riboflavin synthase [Chitinophagaceae bacterium]|nr:riboflavin synthase [Chitinophagaceae bacterium]
MFTGIIETTGIVKEVTANGSNKAFWIESGISSQLKIDQSLSHSGVCLTIEEIRNENHRVTAVDETLRKTNLHTWQVGTIVNLERCLQINDRLDGHIIQGHVDTVGTCIKRKEREGSWEFDFEFPKKFAPLIIEKGSICINGISLTAFNVKKKGFSIAVIPYTFEHTNIKELSERSEVNLEFDIIGKYVYRYLNLNE